MSRRRWCDAYVDQARDVGYRGAPYSSEACELNALAGDRSIGLTEPLPISADVTDRRVVAVTCGSTTPGPSPGATQFVMRVVYGGSNAMMAITAGPGSAPAVDTSRPLLPGRRGITPAALPELEPAWLLLRYVSG